MPRLATLALLCFTALSGIAAAQPAAFPDMLDTTKLPRLPGARELYAFPHTSSFVVSDKVAETAEIVSKALAADGWQEYGPPFSTKTKQPTVEIMTFKRGWQALSVFITLAPAQGGATAVAYTAIAIENDLPFPKDATDIKFAPDRPHLNLFTAESVDTTLAFFSKELGALGWSPWSVKDNAKKPVGEIVAEPTPRGFYAYFVRDGKQPMILVLQRTNDDRTMVELKAFPLNMMAGATPQVPGSQQPGASVPASQASRERQERREVVKQAGDAIAEVRAQTQAIRDEIADLRQQAKNVAVQELPRLEGARINAERTNSDRVNYQVDGTLESTIAALTKMLAGHGWAYYEPPLDPPSRHTRWYKRGRQSLHVWLTTPHNPKGVIGVDYSLSRIEADAPVPEGAADVIFDDRRPYLSAHAPGTVESLLDFYRKELTDGGWRAWSAADAARWPDAATDEAVPNGVRVYFVRDRRNQPEPIQVTLTRRADGRVEIEVRVPPFARPKDLVAGQDSYGLPKPERIKSASSTDGRAKKEMTVKTPTELSVVLAFYRRELEKRGWKEEARGAIVTNDEVFLNFTTPDSTAVLKITHKYDLTIANLVQQQPVSVTAARDKKQRDADQALMKKIEEFARAPAVTEVPQAGAVPANSPLPVPATASNPDFDSAKGELKFDTASSVPEIAAFYRNALKPLGFKENPTPIDNATMAALDFSRGGKRMHITIMRMGAKTNVRAYGAALGGDLPRAAQAQPQRTPAIETANAPAPEEQKLEAEEKDGLPIPRPSTQQGITKTQFRIEAQTTVSASVDAVLAFYRTELKKLNWKEEPGAQASAERASVSFTAPEGPAVLTITRKARETTATLLLRKPAVAEQAGIKPKAGQAKVLLGNIMDTEATVMIDKRTFKLVAGAGGRKPDGPTLDLRPGTYKYTVTVPGKPPFNEEVKVSADEAWGVIVGPGGGLSLQVY